MPAHVQGWGKVRGQHEERTICGRRADPTMLIVCALGFLIWFVFGVAVTAMMVYGVFDNVAMGPAARAIAAAFAARRARRDRFR